MRGYLSSSEVLALVAYVVDLLFGDDLGFPHGHYGLAGGWPDEPPRPGRDGPESLARLDIHEGESVVAVFGSDGHEETGLGRGVFRRMANTPSTHHLVPVVRNNR